MRKTEFKSFAQLTKLENPELILIQVVEELKLKNYKTHFNVINQFRQLLKHEKSLVLK